MEYPNLTERESKELQEYLSMHQDDLLTHIVDLDHDVLYLGFSSGLSGTYQNACMAAEMLSEQYPQRT